MVECAPAVWGTGLPDVAPAEPAFAGAATPPEILRFVAEASRRGQRAALVTITGLTGSSSRPVGTLMGVTEDGRFAGSFSGGCIEAAVVAEAVEAIRDGRPRQVRYGAGSPYIDIRLPCGGGVDLLFQPTHDPDVIRQAVSRLEARQPLTLAQGASGGLHILAESAQPLTGWRGETFISWYAPSLRLVVVGHGAESLALVQLGLTSGFQMTLLTPAERLVSSGKRLGAHTVLLTTSGPSLALMADPWSAVVFLFHDHAWEPLLLEQVITQPWFFIGAMGSQRTQENRLNQLRERGIPAEILARIIAPLGLIPSARDPMTLALSALAQVVDCYRRIAATPSGDLVFHDRRP
ncbi:XdhC family protein [Microvirga zambiensis]|uniref:XdhC family protein n=1 Tax=Microvirga zambiensis TaxID=1402137 RepID=UPI00191D405A|nr:XdhC family protein [Microvirga zambiensis]